MDIMNFRTTLVGVVPCLMKTTECEGGGAGRVVCFT